MSAARIAPAEPATSAPLDAGHGDAASGSEPADPLQWLTADVLVEDGEWTSAGDLDSAVADTVAALWRYLPRCEPRLLLATVVFETDAAVQALNLQFRQQDKPTNVLSFQATPPPAGVKLPAGEPVHIGDVVLAAETVMREARDLTITPRAHVQHLVLHGLLHLLGHDHDISSAAQRMEAIETSVLATLGIADPYAGAELA
jgi:probable rRNA maturation factor